MVAKLDLGLVQAKLVELLSGAPEELPLRVFKSGNMQVRRRGLPAGGGVYSFLWKGDKRMWQQPSSRRTIRLSGPGGRAIAVTYDDDWLRLSSNAPIPLYVGKTTDFRNRLSLHCCGKTTRVPPGRSFDQVRRNLESVFPPKIEPDGRRLVRENVGYRFVSLHGDEHVVNRFYLENLAIATLQPLFNVDTER